MISPFFYICCVQNLLIYIPKITARHKYVFKVIFNEIYQVEYQLTDDKDFYLTSTSPRLNYSKSIVIDGEVFVESADLLQERQINEVEVNFLEINENPYLFATTHQESYHHDLFAATFYLISRYEEYFPHLKDKYGRYKASESIAYKEGFLKRPIVNIWVQEFIAVLEDKYPELQINKPKFKYISTIDIDNAYLYKGKGFVRFLAFLIKSVLSFNFSEIKQAVEVVFRKRKDPYDTYSLQFNLQKKYDLNVKYFVLLGDYGLNDKNLSHTNSNVNSLIKRLADLAPVGIHPSFGSNKNIVNLQEEIKRLEYIQKREVSLSRQHFLKLSLPETYKKLIASGITDDYTMGYASELGFRAGIASSFTFYDLDMEQELPIRIHPFAITDDVLKFNMKISADDVVSEISELIDTVKKIDGTLISVWHNDTFSNFGQWKGWKNVYEEMVKLIKK